MQTITGDLLKLAKEGRFDVIVHGCNCFCQMGAGIAKFIKREFPEAYTADCTTARADKGKLGTYSLAKIARGDIEFVIVNAYTQFDWRGTGLKADYAAIARVFKGLANEFAGKRIGYPLIGAGLAGGDWNVIAAIIDQELVGLDHTLVKLPQ